MLEAEPLNGRELLRLLRKASRPGQSREQVEAIAARLKAGKKAQRRKARKRPAERQEAREGNQCREQ